MADLEKFKKTIGGGIRPNQFRVSLVNSPSIVGLTPDFSFLCHAASLPGSTIGQAPTFHRGRMIPLAGERTFDPWSIVVYADQDMNVRRSFEKWGHFINNYRDNTGETNPDRGTGGYKGEFVVELLRRNDTSSDLSTLSTYNIRGMFPINISEMQLSWQQNDVVGEFSVTFAVEDVIPWDVA